MKPTLISKENNIAKFSMEFSAEEFEQACAAVYQRQKGKFAVDGFRKGKAPRSIIEKRYGEGIFFEDAVDDLVGKEYSNAIEELKIEPVGRPTADFTPLKKGEGFIMTVDIEVYPEIEAKDYKGVEIVKTVQEVNEDDLNVELEMLQKRNSRLVEVDRPIQLLDNILLDSEGTIDGEKFEGGSAERYSLIVGSNTFIPGFEDQLIGLKAGDEKDVEVTFPEDYHAEELKGKPAVFKCKIHEVKEEQLPELDDEFAKDVSEFDTLEEMKANMLEKLKKEAAERDENKMKNDCLEKVLEKNDIKVPESMVETEIEQMLDEFDAQLRSQGISMDEYYKYLNKTEDDFKEDYRKDAERKVKIRMLVRAIAEQENIEVTPEDVENELKLMAENYGLELDKLKEMIGTENLDFIEKDVKMTKAVDFIYNNAVIK